jgi:hypothetical protein
VKVSPIAIASPLALNGHVDDPAVSLTPLARSPPVRNPPLGQKPLGNFPRFIRLSCHALPR